jgi:peptidoglycan hydrolase-like protein with peptidoglycan-binding domain
MAQKAQLTSASNIVWSGGDLFNGYVLLIAALPSSGGGSWSRVALRNTRPALCVPLRYRVPIREGQYVPDAQIWRTDALVPPNVRYSAFFYDSTDRLIAIGADLFAVAADLYTLAPPVLNDPLTAVVSPTPETVPSVPVVVYPNAPGREDVAGTKNGLNTTFAVSRNAAVVFIIWNGQVLDEGVGYTRVGTAIEMVVAPSTIDTLEAVLW